MAAKRIQTLRLRRRGREAIRRTDGAFPADQVAQLPVQRADERCDKRPGDIQCAGRGRDIRGNGGTAIQDRAEILLSDQSAAGLQALLDGARICGFPGRGARLRPLHRDRDDSPVRGPERGFGGGRGIRARGHSRREGQCADQRDRQLPVLRRGHEGHPHSGVRGRPGSLAGRGDTRPAQGRGTPFGHRGAARNRGAEDRVRKLQSGYTGPRPRHAHLRWSVPAGQDQTGGHVPAHHSCGECRSFRENIGWTAGQYTSRRQYAPGRRLRDRGRSR